MRRHGFTVFIILCIQLFTLLNFVLNPNELGWHWKINRSTYLKPTHSVVISYAIYLPKLQRGEKIYKRPDFRQCLSNLEYFLESGIVDSEGVEYVFSLIGDSVLVKPLEIAQERHKNLKVIRTRQVPADLVVHGNVLNSYLFSKSHFIVMNCGVRGPYFNHNNPQINWINSILSKLNNETRVVSPTLSCELSPHLQSYFIAMDQRVASIFAKLWSWSWFDYFKSIKKKKLIYNNEVGATTLLLKQGIGITTLDSRYYAPSFKNSDQNHAHNKHSREPSENVNSCTLERVIYGEGIQLNPCSCRREFSVTGAPGCDGVEPCEVMFVKYGGEIVYNNVSSRVTEANMAREERVKSEMCSSPIYPFHPRWNVPALLSHILLPYDKNNKSFSPATQSDIMIILNIRPYNAHMESLHTHGSEEPFHYSIHRSVKELHQQLAEFLKSMFLTQKRLIRVRILLICLSNFLCEYLQNKRRKLPQTELLEHVSIQYSFLRVPTLLVHEYYDYLKRLCSQDLQRYRVHSTNGKSSSTNELIRKEVCGSNIDRDYVTNLPLNLLLQDSLIHWASTSSTNTHSMVILLQVNDVKPDDPQYQLPLQHQLEPPEHSEQDKSLRRFLDDIDLKALFENFHGFGNSMVIGRSSNTPIPGLGQKDATLPNPKDKISKRNSIGNHVHIRRFDYHSQQMTFNSSSYSYEFVFASSDLALTTLLDNATAESKGSFFLSSISKPRPSLTDFYNLEKLFMDNLFI